MAANRVRVLCFLLVLIPFVWCSSQRNILSANDVVTISSNRTITSPNDIFELGFFKLAAPDSEDGDRWYLGMWYKSTSTRNLVWVANRDRPVSSSKGSLKISNSSLVIVNEFGALVWSSNSSALVQSSAVVAELMDSGNFVVRLENKNRDSVIWESFKFPTDTLLPGMKLGVDSTTGVDTMLTSWKSEYDPSIGPYSYRMDTKGLPQMFLWMGTKPVYRNILGDLLFSYRKTTYQLPETGQYLHLKVTYYGRVQQFSWSPTTRRQELIWGKPDDECDYFNYNCGPNTLCSTEEMGNATPVTCECFHGFPKMLLGNIRIGCSRRTALSCNPNDNTFYQLGKVKLPYTTKAIVERSIGLKDCRQRCLKDCKCSGFAYVEMDCLMYTENFSDVRNLTSDGQDVYVKVAGGKGRRISRTIEILMIIGGIIIIIVILMLWWHCKRKKRQTRAIARNTDVVMDGDKTDSIVANEEFALPRMEYPTICDATNGFCDSNKLGQGGFGVVYKGRLSDGREVAVKRLSSVSNEGASQFSNEVNLISKLQHINLVRLLGFCVHGEEHLLVYEYLENLSLDFYLFGNSPGSTSKLTWPTRYEIIHGIARGLTYLHQDSCFRVIHRDLKPSNILLDKDMIPKIADFGLARLVGRDESQTKAMAVSGTRGYMSPEYRVDAIFSEKSDVFSFGVLVLELFTGKRNWKFMNSEGDTCLLRCVWRKWEEGRLLEIVDPSTTDSLSSSSRVSHIIRCVQIALLCVQDCPEDRPIMSSVVVMLESSVAVGNPKPPGHYDHARTSTSTGPAAYEDESILEPR